jgi:hypothetical protein
MITKNKSNLTTTKIIDPAAKAPPLHHSKRGGPLKQTSLLPPPTNSEKLRGELSAPTARPESVLEKLKAGAGAAWHTFSKKVLSIVNLVNLYGKYARQ